MDYEVTNIRGLNTRDNDIHQNEFNCEDCLNVRLDDNGRLSKINAFSKNYILPSEIFILDSYHIKSRDELFIVEVGKFSRITNASKQDASSVYEVISTPSPFFVHYSGRVSFQEFNNSLYIADPSDYSFVQKYDGQSVSRAGVGYPTVVGTSVGTTRFFRSYIGMKDANGLESAGDYTQISVEDDGTNIVVDANLTYNSTRLDRNIKGMTLAIGALLVQKPTIITGSFTASASEYNLEVGDIIYAWAQAFSGAGPFGQEVKLTVSSITPNGLNFDIVFDIYTDGSLDQLESIYFSGAISSCKLYFSYSDFETYGYQIIPPNSSQFSTIENYMWYRNVFTDNISYTLALNRFTSDLEDYYDSTIVKGDMPKMRYIGSFQNQIVGVTGDFSIAWSDLGLASSCETFAPFDTETFNKSEEGPITGIFGGDSHVSVFKESEIYHIQGILYAKSYRIVSDSSSGIGCISNSSIVRFSGGCLFMSDRGIYFSNGQLSKELTDHIESRMKQFALFGSDIVAFADYANERIVFSSFSESFEYDYYRNEWFVHSIFGDGTSSKLYKSIDDGSLMRLSGLSTDVALDSNIKSHVGLYKTSWMTMGDPYKEKKFNYFSVLSVLDRVFKMRVDSYWNWKSDSNESMEKTFDTDVFLNKFGIRTKRANSFSFTVNSPENEDLLINGFIINYEPSQGKVRA